MYAIRSYYAVDIGGDRVQALVGDLEVDRLAGHAPVEDRPGYRRRGHAHETLDALAQLDEPGQVYLGLGLAQLRGPVAGQLPDRDHLERAEAQELLGDGVGVRITSYNVCYTKLLR